MKLPGFLLLFVLVLLTQSSEAPQPEAPPTYGAKYVADAAEQLTGHRAHMSNEIRLIAGTRLAGPALTMRIVRDDTASRTTEGYAAIKAVENAPEGSVVLAALDDAKDYAVFGATFVVLARARKLAGFVVDGSVRSAPELRRLEFPVFARGTVPGSAGGHYRLDGINVPILCGGIQVMPGDYVVADEDGVAVAPKEHYQEVLVNAEKMWREDQAILPLIEKYASYTEALRQLKAASAKP